MGSKKLGMWLFIIADALTFSILILAYAYIRLASPDWPKPFAFSPAILGATLMTFFLLSSSLTMVMAVAAAPLTTVISEPLPPPLDLEAAAAPGADPPPPAPAGPPPAAEPAVRPSATGEVTFEPVRPTNIFVQAGAFTQYDNANRLRARLSGLGPTRVTRVDIAGQLFFRVRLGPIASVGEADRLLALMIDAGYPEARIVVD